MYGLETATVVDEFFCFLRELGLWEKLETLEPADRKREMLGLAPMVLLYFLKVLSGIKAMDALPELLFANRGLGVAQRCEGGRGTLEHGQWDRA
jgi:hypothetical protein